MYDSITWGYLITELRKMGSIIHDTFSDVLKFITDPIAISPTSSPELYEIFETLKYLLGFEDVTILGLMIGGGVTTVLVISLVKWIIGIVT